MLFLGRVAFLRSTMYHGRLALPSPYIALHTLKYNSELIISQADLAQNIELGEISDKMLLSARPAHPS